MIKAYDADLVCLNETKTINNSSVTVDRYKRFEFQQSKLYANAKSGLEVCAFWSHLIY